MRACAICIPDPFKAAVVVTRHPLHAFFAEFNRIVSRGRHTGRMKKRRFNATSFKRLLMKDAYLTRGYYLRDYLNGVVATMLPDHYIFVRFEDLVSKNITTRRSALRRIVSFLAPHSGFSDDDLARGFKLAEKQHRPPPRSDEIKFSEVVTPGLARRYYY